METNKGSMLFKKIENTLTSNRILQFVPLLKYDIEFSVYSRITPF